MQLSLNNFFSMLTGLSGVAADETLAARRWARRFELPMILLAIWMLIEWYLRGKNIYSPLFAQVTDWFIWLFFFIETVVITSLVDDKLRYLRSNWMNLFIITVAFPLLWIGTNYAAILRTLRVLLIFPMLLNVSATVRKVLAKNYLGPVLLIALAFTLISGLIMAGIDPAIEDVWEGIWWAWVTVATVGYGDTVPETPAGRIFGALVILFGVGFFSLLTASFSAYFVSRGEVEIEEEIEEEELEEMSELKNIEMRIDAMEKTLRRIEQRLDQDRGG
jgi:voltage-gated potassium channel